MNEEKLKLLLETLIENVSVDEQQEQDLKTILTEALE